MGYKQAMELKNWLTNNDVSVSAFAKRIGVTRQAVYSYIRGDKIPSPVTMKEIVVETSGAVTPNSFYNIEAQP